MRFENEFAGLSVLCVLTSRLGFSRRSIARLKRKENGILINGAHATVRAVIREGDVLTVNFEDETADSDEKLIPSDVLPDIIYEDDDIIAVNKPPFMPTHQSHGHFNDTLANSLALYFKRQDRPFVFRSVNRLDRNTSGAVLVAKSNLSAHKLSRSMKLDGIKKTYLAILSGTLPEQEGVICSYIRRKEKSVILREACGKTDDAKLSVTKYRVIAQDNGLSLVLARAVTGRTHQLRVHFSLVGASILGDDLYGESSPLIARHALHSLHLTLDHPTTHKALSLTARIPDDMQKIINENFETENLTNELNSL